MKKTVFIKNALILTVSSFILRFAGIIFKVWLAGAIGSEGIGLHGLIFSVYVLASTFATSGISTAVTRLVAEETALGSKKGTLKILRRSIELTVIISIVTIAILYFGAEFIANRL
ncbi:MAG: oligosaccharide flippase family protein, partial [Clostridia bacterium]|nr:oligosaccharide flippase family protein [Clostridia bacterium]